VLTRKTQLRSKTQLKARSPLKAASPGRSTLKSKASKPSKIRLSAKGEQCLVRVPGVCNGNAATVVLAHLNGAGTGMKHSDHLGAYGCSACHSWLDGGYVQQGFSRDTRDLWHLQAVVRTQDLLIDKGFIQIQGAA
jgi:hypothetical protein